MMVDLSDKYNTPIPPDLMPDYLRWVQQQSQKKGYDVRLDAKSYDIQGLFMALHKGEKGLYDEKTGHSTDRFKKPNHISFSNESMYAKDGLEGGKWTYTDKGTEFTPGKTNYIYNQANDIFKYFREREPNIKLNLPNTKVSL
jgi:hypothetical protein